jgi:hypothetical protein
MSKTLIAIVAIALIVAITIWVVKRCCARCDQRQFPSAYTLLKSSPLIDRRETVAVRFILVLMVVFVLLLLTSAI